MEFNTQNLQYFVSTGIYDTDVLYYIFLNLKNPSKVGKYRNFASSFFFNSTRYLIRNVEFGPMFDQMYPENIIFGYRNHYIEAEHKAVDYLDGDDCTVNPSIGWNPYFWQTTDQTFEHLKLKQKVHTGAEENSDIRKYDSYCESKTVIYRKLVFDETGDECFYDSSNPFTTAALVAESTDGYQFNQSAGKSAKGATKVVLDRDLQRPMQLIRPNSLDYEYRGLLANPYVMPFKSDYGCKNGIFMRNAIDMSSFLQLHAVITKPQLKGIDEPGLIKPNMTYIYPLEKDEAPYGVPREDSFYVVEPYTGITLWFGKKMMMSIVLYYDELYDKLPEGGHGEILPYYVMYETGKVSNNFVEIMEKEINDAQYSRKATMVAFTVFGLIFVFTGIGMIARAFFFKEVVSDSTDTEVSKKEPEREPSLQPENKEVVSLVVSETAEEPVQEKMLLQPDSEGEDLQKDEIPIEENKELTA